MSALNDFKELKIEVEKINNHVKQNDKKIEECNFIFYNSVKNNYF